MKIEDLGLTKDKLTQLVVDQIVGNAYDGESFISEASIGSSIEEQLKERVTASINETVDRIGNEVILPKVNEMIENHIVQKTNEWGEEKGEPKTFVEHLIARADYYMQEPVDHNGKTKAEDSYNWRKNTTRICYLVDHHLQYSISVAMEAALKEANSSIAEGLKKAVSIQIDKVRAKLDGKKR